MQEPKKAPSIRYDSFTECWWLHDEELDDEVGYSMAIDRHWDGKSWDHYTFWRWDMGERKEVLTGAEFDERVKDVAQREGDEEAAAFREHHLSIHIVRDSHPVFELRKWYEHMVGLGLLNLEVTLNARPHHGA